MKLSDPKKATVSMIYDALLKVDELLTKYTGDNWAEICTSFDSPTNLTGLPKDEILKESLFFSHTAAEAFVIGFGVDWPENRILREKLINLRNRWIDFIEKDPDLYLNFIEFHYLNRILSSWEENLGLMQSAILKNQKSLGSVKGDTIFGWHYALSLVILQSAGILEKTNGRKQRTIDQISVQFDLPIKKADNIYHSTKNMKKPHSDDWDLEYFFKTYATKKRNGYKEIVRLLLMENVEANDLLNNLPD